MADRKPNSKKQARAEKAQRHAEQMAARFGKEIERSLAGVQRLEAPVTSEVEGRVPEVRVMAADAVAAILENGRGRAEFCDLAVLDFASFTNPGGGYIRGSWAQEEALCAESFLYNVLEKQGDWYGENRRRNINCDLYRNRALVVPKVRFSREKIHAYADVLVVDPPRAGLAPEAIRLIASTSARDVAYVSCDPATLARDLRRFVEEGTFRPVWATPVDLFPQTFHCETVVRLTRA